MSDPLPTVEQAAERLGTTVRFLRCLIAERRITFIIISDISSSGPHDPVSKVSTFRG